MEDFPANSARIRRPEAPEDEPKRIERVTSGEVDQRKRGIGRKFKETFVGGSARGAIDYMVIEVVVPAIQDTMLEAMQGGLERLIKGDTRPRRSSVSSTYAGLGQVNYQGMSTSASSAPRALSRTSRTRHDFGEIVIQHRQEAAEVLEQMFEILSHHGSVSVSDLYELTGIQSSHTDLKWGWRALPGAKIDRLRGGAGFLLNLPQPEPL